MKRAGTYQAGGPNRGRWTVAIGMVIYGMWLAFFLLAAVPAHTATDDSVEERIVKANQAYKEDRFTDAVDLYRSVIDQGFENGQIYYNLGNAYLRSRQLGQAILQYQRARLLMPRDADLKFNLRYALDRTKDDVPDNRGALYQAFFWLDEVNLTELFFGFMAVNILFWGLLSIRLFSKAEWSYYAFIVVLFLAVLAGASLGIKWYELHTDRRGVILAPEVNVLAGPDEKDTVLFKLHEGAILDYERQEDDWALIGLSDTKRGWIKAADIERILLR